MGPKTRRSTPGGRRGDGGEGGAHLEGNLWLFHSIGLNRPYGPLRHLPQHSDLLPLVLLVASPQVLNDLIDISIIVVQCVILDSGLEQPVNHTGAAGQPLLCPLPHACKNRRCGRAEFFLAAADS